jgi:hypothetical protein
MSLNTQHLFKMKVYNYNQTNLSSFYVYKIVGTLEKRVKRRGDVSDYVIEVNFMSVFILRGLA